MPAPDIVPDAHTPGRTAPELQAAPPDLALLSAIVRTAGEAILQVRAGGYEVRRKADQSPLTEADLASHRIIARGLAEHFPDIPVVSEEGDLPPPHVRQEWDRFFLVDPLDGTKEFVKDNGEFCVCLALIQDRFPVMGAVYVPMRAALYAGGLGLGAWRTLDSGPARPIRSVPPEPGQGLVVVASRSHPDPRLEACLAGWEVGERITAGSALKFCLVAEGRAHLYPRFNPTSEWDTAAGQAVLEGAGGSMRTLDGERFAYNKPDILNPGFMAAAGGLDLKIPC